MKFLLISVTFEENYTIEKNMYFLQNQNIKDKAAKHFPEIIKILAEVDPQFPLIFKTIQLLTNIESILGSRNNFEQMSRAIMRAIVTERSRHCQSKLDQTKFFIIGQWDQLRITIKHHFFHLIWLSVQLNIPIFMSLVWQGLSKNIL